MFPTDGQSHGFVSLPGYGTYLGTLAGRPNSRQRHPLVKEKKELAQVWMHFFSTTNALHTILFFFKGKLFLKIYFIEI